MPSKKTSSSDMTNMPSKKTAKPATESKKSGSKKAAATPAPAKEPVVEQPPAPVEAETTPEVVEPTPASEAEVEWVTAHTEILRITEQIAELEKRRRALTKTCDKWAKKMIQKLKKQTVKGPPRRVQRPPVASQGPVQSPQLSASS